MALLVEQIKEEHPETACLQIWYLDDGTIAGDIGMLARIVHLIKSKGREYGLIISPNKCCGYFPQVTEALRAEFQQIMDDIPIVTEGILTVGLPLGTDQFIGSTIAKTIDGICAKMDRIAVFDSPQAMFVILQHCMGLPQIQHLLRAIPSDLIASSLKKLSDAQDRLLHAIMNNGPANDFFTELRSLPCKFGGLGILNPMDIADAAYLAGEASSIALQRKILKDETISTSPKFSEIAKRFIKKCKPEWTEELLFNEAKGQRGQFLLSKLVHAASIAKLSSNPKFGNDAFRVLETHKEDNSSGWLQSLPRDFTPTKSMFPGKYFILALKRRLYLPIYGSITCTRPECEGSGPDVIQGTHALSSCKYGVGCHTRHNKVVREFKNQMTSAGWKDIEEDVKIYRDQDKRPGDLRVPHWDFTGKTAYFDVTIVGCANSNCVNPMEYLQRQHDRKMEKHNAEVESAGGIFIPLVFDVGGGCTDETKKVIQIIARRKADRDQDYTSTPKETAKLRIAISTALQYANGQLLFDRLPVIG